jgi:hypothetical protein
MIIDNLLLILIAVNQWLLKLEIPPHTKIQHYYLYSWESNVEWLCDEQQSRWLGHETTLLRWWCCSRCAPAVCNQTPKECTRSQTYRSVGRRGRRKMNMWMQPQWLEKTTLEQPIGQTPDGCRRLSQRRASLSRKAPKRDDWLAHTQCAVKVAEKTILCDTPLRQVLIWFPCSPCPNGEGVQLVVQTY